MSSPNICITRLHHESLCHQLLRFGAMLSLSLALQSMLPFLATTVVGVQHHPLCLLQHHSCILRSRRRQSSASPFGATTPIFRPTCLVLLFCFLFASFGAVCQSPCLQHLQSLSLAEQEGGELGGLLVTRLARCVANRAAAPRTHVHVTSFCWQILLAAVRWQCAGHMQTCLSRDFPDRHSSPLLPERPMCP